MFEVTDNDTVRTSGARIKVVGVGGGGCNAVNTMIRSGLTGVEYVVANTDAQALNASLAPTKIQLGGSITKGLGAGANPEVGKKSALEDFEKISEILKGADMVFITAGMGGGTGTGAAPVIAKLAKDLGALTVGVVTKPFIFEGKKRFRQAEDGIRNLEESVDSLITIPNQRLLYLAGENLSLVETFKRADEVLLNAVRGISDLINNTGHINADFADVSTVMANKGLALMGTGSASGAGRAIKAATEAISSPLLEDISINGATGIIINITGSDTLSMHETNEAVTLIMEAADENAEIIFGTVIDNNCGDEVKVTVIATGLGIMKNIQVQSHVNVQAQSTPTTQHIVNNLMESNSFAANNFNASSRTAEAINQINLNQTQSQNTPSSNVSDIRNFETRVEANFETRIEQRTEQRAEQRPEQRIEQRAEVKNDHPRREDERSDFDRFMHEKNATRTNQGTQFSHGPSTTGNEFQFDNGAESKQPSRLIQQIRDAANRYETQPNQRPVAPTVNSFSQNQEASINNRTKSIAEKLGFVNFDEDEFDTPSYLRKDEKTEQRAPVRDFKNLDL